MTGRPVVILLALFVVSGIAFGVHRFVTRDPTYDDGKAAASFIARLNGEAPLASDVDLPMAQHGTPINKVHPRVELGKKELRLFGELVHPMPPLGATTLSATDLTSVAEWGSAAMREAGIPSRTLELGVDRDVCFGVVVDALQALGAAEFSPQLFLARAADGSTVIFKPDYGLGAVRIALDTHGAHGESTGDASAPACNWAVGAPAAPFIDCIAPPSAHDAGVDAGEQDFQSLLTQMLGRPELVDVRPSPDVRWSDVILMLDALAAAGKSFTLSFDRSARH